MLFTFFNVLTLNTNSTKAMMGKVDDAAAEIKKWKQKHILTVVFFNCQALLAKIKGHFT